MTAGSTAATAPTAPTATSIITGRVKDIVIRGGRNLYPQEIEEAVGARRRRAQGLRGGVRQRRPGQRHRAPGGAGRDPAGRPRRRRRRLREAVSRAVLDAIGEPPDESRAGAAAQRAQDVERQGAALGLPRRLSRPAASAQAAPTARRQALRLAFGALAARLRQSPLALAARCSASVAALAVLAAGRIGVADHGRHGQPESGVARQLGGAGAAAGCA